VHTILSDYLEQVRRSTIYTAMESGLHSSEGSIVKHRLHPPKVATVNGQCHRSEDPNGSVNDIDHEYGYPIS
jgi:hypothetical protein